MSAALIDHRVRGGVQIAGARREISTGEGHQMAELTHTDLVAVFGAGTVRRARSDGLPDGIAHAPTRRFLTQVGVPVSEDDPVVTFHDGFPERPVLLRDDPAAVECALETSSELQHAYHVGFGGGGVLVHVALDGRSGRVLAIEENEGTSYLLNSDVESFVAFLQILERHRELYGFDHRDQHGDGDVGTGPAQVADLVMKLMRAVDPAPFQEPAGTVHRFWQGVLAAIEDDE